MSRASPHAVHLLLVLSGFAGLGYQVLWTRMLSTGLGHEAFAALAVVAAFFAGLALGAAALDRPIARSHRPGLWYAGLEAAVGLWTLALIWLIPAATDALPALMGPEPSELWRWSVAFAASALLLGPATAAMGATMAAAERMFARLAGDGEGVGGLYAANVAGATAGALLTAVWLAPAFGYSASLLVFAGVNFLCAGLTLLGPARGEAARPPLPPAEAGAGPTRSGLALLAATGFLGIGYEVAVIRALAQVTHNTVYTFAAALSVYLCCAAIGAALYQRRLARSASEGLTATLLLATGAASALGALTALGAPAAHPSLRDAFGGGVAAELALAALVFAPSSLAMGALFAHLAQMARGPDGGVGAAFAVNTLGAAAAPAAVGVLAIPALGPVGALAALSLGYPVLAAVAGSAGAARGFDWRRAALGSAGPALAAAAVFGPFDRTLTVVPAGGALISHVDGVASSASTVRDASGHRHLVVNGTFVMGGTASRALDRAQAHAALMLHPAPERALFLGVGVGATVAGAAAYPGLRADGVDLSPEVLALLPDFAGVNAEIAQAKGRIALRVADARRWVRAAPEPYDVIVADNFHPARDGAGMLYTVEHFAAVRAALRPGGVFAQWLPLHQLDLATLRLIARSFLAVFPDARLQMGNYNLGAPIVALIGSREGVGGWPRLDALAERPLPPGLRAELESAGIDGPFALLGGFIAGPQALAAFAGPGPLNLDDHPRAMFEAPRTVYRPLGPPSERLFALIEQTQRRAADATTAPPEHAEFGRRLEAYWAARDQFLRLGAQTALTGEPARDAELLAAPLLDILRLSPDFTPAHGPLIALAEALAGADAQAALALLAEVGRADPRRPDAARLADAIRRTM